jgi:glycerophosphoryl diester phosphodiesterase
MSPRPWPWARVLAHRGGGTLAPENTLAGLRVGLEHGFHAVEFDVMLAGDEVPLLVHDERLGRTVAGDEAVSALPAATLMSREAGAWHSPRYAGARVPAFEAVLAWCRAHRVWPNIEIKPATGHEARTGELVARATAHAYADCVRAGGDRAAGIAPEVPLFSSFKKDALAAARVVAPNIPRGWLIDRVPSDWHEQMAEVGAVALHTNYRHLSAALAAQIKAAGYWLFCYTVNQPERARELLDWGVDAFCTDRIDLIGPRFAD